MMNINVNEFSTIQGKKSLPNETFPLCTLFGLNDTLTHYAGHCIKGVDKALDIKQICQEMVNYKKNYINIQ